MSNIHLARIADNLDRIARSLEDSAAMTKEAVQVDPAKMFDDAIEAMKKSNPIMRAAFEQTEQLMLGKTPVKKGELDASSGD